MSIFAGPVPAAPERRHAAPDDPPATTVDATNVLVQAIQSLLSTQPTSPLGLGTLEACAGLWARGLVAAELTGLAGQVLTPDQRGVVGRQLVRRGESVWAISVRDGVPLVVPATTWDVWGSSPAEADWWYRLDVAVPSGATRPVTLPSAGVLHFRYGYDPRSPWRGLAPLDFAHRTGELAGQLERALAQEASSPVGFLLPLPEGSASGDDDEDPAAMMMAAIRTLAGRVKAVETTAGGWGDRGQAPAGDFQLRRVGPQFTAAEIAAEQAIAPIVCAACGVPPSLVIATGDGTSQRESWRRFLHSTLAPLGELLLGEVRAKLDPEATIGWSELAAADVAGRARAWRTLVGREASMPDADARRVAGIDAGAVVTAGGAR